MNALIKCPLTHFYECTTSTETFYLRNYSYEVILIQTLFSFQIQHQNKSSLLSTPKSRKPQKSENINVLSTHCPQCSGMDSSPITPNNFSMEVFFLSTKVSSLNAMALPEENKKQIWWCGGCFDWWRGGSVDWVIPYLAVVCYLLYCVFFPIFQIVHLFIYFLSGIFYRRFW